MDVCLKEICLLFLKSSMEPDSDYVIGLNPLSNHEALCGLSTISITHGGNGKEAVHN